MAKKKRSESPEQPKKKKADAAQWTDEQDSFLVEQLLAAKLAGNMSENSFKKTLFAQITGALELQHPSIKGATKTQTSVSSRWQKLKIDYKVVHNLREQSGFGWDDEHKLVTAPDEVWDQYIKTHKDAGRFHKKGFPLYEGMHTICNGVIAKGSAAFNSGYFPPLRQPSASHTRTPSSGSIASSKSSESEDKEGPPSVVSDEKPPVKKHKSSSSQSHLKNLRATDSDSVHALPGTPARPRRQRNTTGSAFAIIAESLEGIAAAIVPPPIPLVVVDDPLSKAICLLEQETALSDSDKAAVIDSFIANGAAAKAYLAITNPTTRTTWISQRIKHVREE